MSEATIKLIAAALLVLVLVLAGCGGGAWIAARHYRPLLDTANMNLANASAARDNLEALAGEQGKKLGELVQAGELRELNAALAQEAAKAEAQPDYAAANRIQQERTGGDPATAAMSIIDKELGL